MAEDFDPVEVRKKMMAKRQEMMARRIPKRPVISVTPADDDVRQLIKHPRAGGFPEDGPASWPLDRFTRRRLLDGAVTSDDAPTAA